MFPHACFLKSQGKKQSFRSLITFPAGWNRHRSHTKLNRERLKTVTTKDLPLGGASSLQVAKNRTPDSIFFPCLSPKKCHLSSGKNEAPAPVPQKLLAPRLRHCRPRAATHFAKAGIHLQQNNYPHSPVLACRKSKKLFTEIFRRKRKSAQKKPKCQNNAKQFRPDLLLGGASSLARSCSPGPPFLIQSARSRGPGTQSSLFLDFPE